MKLIHSEMARWKQYGSAVRCSTRPCRGASRALARALSAPEAEVRCECRILILDAAHLGHPARAQVYQAGAACASSQPADITRPHGGPGSWSKSEARARASSRRPLMPSSPSTTRAHRRVQCRCPHGSSVLPRKGDWQRPSASRSSRELAQAHQAGMGHYLRRRKSDPRTNGRDGGGCARRQPHSHRVSVTSAAGPRAGCSRPSCATTGARGSAPSRRGQRAKGRICALFSRQLVDELMQSRWGLERARDPDRDHDIRGSGAASPRSAPAPSVEVIELLRE